MDMFFNVVGFLTCLLGVLALVGFGICYATDFFASIAAMKLEIEFLKADCDRLKKAIESTAKKAK